MELRGVEMEKQGRASSESKTRCDALNCNGIDPIGSDTESNVTAEIRSRKYRSDWK